MRVAVASSFAYGVSFWLRLADEGCDVRVWISEKESKLSGDGLVPKAGSWPELLAWAREAHDAGRPTLVLFDSSGLGEKADEARRLGLHVLGGGTFCDRLEKDRTFGQDIARAAGAKLPEFEEFSSFAEAREWARDLDPEQGVFWKSDRYLESDATHGATGGEELGEYLDSVIRRFGPRGSCIVQEKVEGVDLSTAVWWNGRRFCTPFMGTIENKKFLNGNVGSATGCSFNAIWWYPEDVPEIAQRLGWPQAAVAFAREQAPPGIYDMNSRVDDEGTPYFLEWTPRFGYDSEPMSLQMFPELSAFLWSVATGGEPADPSPSISYSLRLSVPPYPWEHAKREMKHGALGVEVRGIGDTTSDLWAADFLGYQLAYDPETGLHVACQEGIVGLAYAEGERLSELDESAQETAKELRVSALQYRTDGAKTIAEDAQKLLEAGLEVPTGLLA